ncbi:hypothetical protein Hanom_Chr13g01230881 [Helianthus anomalus]
MTTDTAPPRATVIVDKFRLSPSQLRHSSPPPPPQLRDSSTSTSTSTDIITVDKF